MGTIGRNASEQCDNSLAIEVTVLATQAAIEALAERIERAYRLRRPNWYRGCSSSRVWAAAALTLLQLHQDDPTCPLDPELYVAVQPADKSFADPWAELAQPSSAQRYRRRIREMVRKLRAELRGEIRSAENRIARGEELRTILLSQSQRLSPLGRYIVARRAGCVKLAAHFRTGAVEQHRSCPLYRLASRTLLLPEDYPVREHSDDEQLVAPTRRLVAQILLN